VLERAGLVFAFNFHPTSSYTDYQIGVQNTGCFLPVLSTDDAGFEGEAPPPPPPLPALSRSTAWLPWRLHVGIQRPPPSHRAPPHRPGHEALYLPRALEQPGLQHEGTAPVWLGLGLEA
jgi:hypothetical protein